MQSKTTLLIMFMLFYSVIFVFIGYIYGNTNTVASVENSYGTNFFDFIGQIIIGISVLPLWVNTIIFIPLAIGLAFIIVSSLPTFNGGA